MIVSEKSHQKQSVCIKFLIKKYKNLIKKGIIPSEKMRNSGNCAYDYAHSFFGEKF